MSNNLNQFKPDVDLLPTSNQIARLAGAKSIPITLRVNEQTQAYFESIASNYNTSANTMMSLVLDRYVDSQNHLELNRNELDIIVIRKHLERAVKIVKKLDDLTLLRRLIETDSGMEAMSGQGCDANDILADYLAACKGEYTDDMCVLKIWTSDAEFHCIENSPNGSAILNTEYADAECCDFYDLYINPQKWVVVCYIMKAFEDGVNRLLSRKNANLSFVGKKFYWQLVEIINTTSDRAILAQNIAEAYLSTLGLEESVSNTETMAPNDTASKPPLKYHEALVRLFERRGDQRLLPLSVIYEDFYRQAPENGLAPLAKSWKDTIRGTLENNSRDSDKYQESDRNHDYFCNPQKMSGEWGLNPNVHYVEGRGVVVE